MKIILDFFESICGSHQKTLIAHLPCSCVTTVLNYLIFAIKSSGNCNLDLRLSISSANCVYSLCGFIVKHVNKSNQMSGLVATLFESENIGFDALYEVIIETVLTEDSSYIWSLSKALLGIAVVNEEKYQKILVFVIKKITNSIETQQKILDTTNELLVGVQKNLNSQNKEIFSKNFSRFRQNLLKIN